MAILKEILAFLYRLILVPLIQFKDSKNMQFGHTENHLKDNVLPEAKRYDIL